MQFEHLTGKTGLPQNSIYAICQDKQGFLWLGTADGLCRYDGNEMKIFRNNPMDSNSLPGNFIRRLLVDSKGDIWIGTENGLCRYNSYTETFSRIHIPHGDNYSEIAFPYCEMPSGEVLFCSLKYVFFKINITSLKTTEEKFSPDVNEAFQHSSIYSIFNSNGNLIFSDNNSISIYNTINKSFKNWPIKDTNFKFLNDAIIKGDSLYLAKYNGVIVMNLNTGQLRNIELIKIKNTSEKIGVVNKLILAPNGEIIIGTNNNGLLVADANLGNARQYVNNPTDINSLSFNSVRSLFYDNSGNLWVGTDGKGLNKCSVSNRFNLFNSQKNGKDFMPVDFIRCFYEDTEGNLFIGTYGGGFEVIEKDRTASEIFINIASDKLSLPSNNVLCILHDSKDNLWVGTDKGVARFDRKKKIFEKIPGANVLVNSMIETLPGKILVGTNELPFYFCTDSSNAAKLFVDSNLLHITNFSKDWAGNMYAAINRKYLGVDKSMFRTEKNEFGNFYFFADAQSCYASEAGDVWVASKTGLEHWNSKGKLLYKYTSQDGLPDNYLYSILPDKNGNLWISSNNGISKFNIHSSKFRNYDVADGLQATEFNSNAAFISKSGEMFFGGINGFNSFFPDSIKDNPVVPFTVITSCKIFNKEWRGDSSINSMQTLSLPYFENTITFTLASLEFTEPEQNLISYRLLGLDTVWASLGKERVINFMGLSPGHYTLEIKSCNNDGVWSTAIKKLYIQIIPPIWRTTWFLGLCILSILLLLVFVVRFLARRKLMAQLEEIKLRNMLEKERTRISQDMHDEIGSGLSKISILSELAGNKNMQPDEREEQMNKITSTSRQLVDNIQEIIWSLNPRNDTLVGLFSYMHEYANEFFDSTSIHLNFEYPILSVQETVHVKNIVRRNIFLAFKETLNNIVKHSQANLVNIQFSYSNYILQINVSDNGKGINKTDFNKNRNGLQNMKIRMKECDGEVEIKSDTGNGTHIQFRIKLEKSINVTT